MDGYSYSPATGEYQGPILVREDPLEAGKYLLPAFTTLVEPPIRGANQAIVWVGTAWEAQPDYRGATYFDAKGNERTLTEINQIPPAPGPNQVAMRGVDGTWSLVPDYRGTKYLDAGYAERVLTEVNITPPIPGKNEAIYRGSSGAFSVIPDYRGVTYYIAGATADTVREYSIDRPNVPLPAGATLTMPVLPPSGYMVNIERDRRLALGAPITVAGNVVQVQIDPQSIILLTGLGAGANAQIMAGNGAAAMPTPFRDMNNVDHPLTWQQMQQLALGALAAVSTVYTKSWALKAISPIPSDYTADTHWT